MINKEMIMDMLWNAPLSLLALKDEQVIDYLNNLIPYSSAFEIECGKGPNYDEQSFKSIPDIMAVQNDNFEQRYRIPNGLKGIICLYNITTQLKLNSLLNPLSSIHYHVDCTDCWQEISKLVKEDETWILSELDTWLENDKASSRQEGCWYKPNSLQTIEFRLGEMTFDYKIILKRIMHCNQMIKKYKDQLNIEPPAFKYPDVYRILNYVKTLSYTDRAVKQQLNILNNKIAELNKPEEVKPEEQPEDIQAIFRPRTHKINKPSK